MLGDVRPFKVHFDRRDEQTLPCDQEDCYYCQNEARYAPRTEGYAPTLVLDDDLPWRWHHYISVFTEFTVARHFEGPQRGRMLDVVKHRKGRSTLTKVTALKQSHEPLVGWFDVLEHLRRAWYPGAHPQPLAVPGPFEYETPPERGARVVVAEAVTFSVEEKKAAMRAAKLAAGLDPDKELGTALAERDCRPADTPLVEAVEVNGAPVPHAPPSADPTPRPSFAERPAGVSSHGEPMPLDDALTEVEQLAQRRTGEIICDEQKARRGRVLTAEEEREKSTDVIRGNFKVGGKNGHLPKGGAK